MVTTSSTNPAGTGLATMDIESTHSASRPAAGKLPESWPYRRGISCFLRGAFGTYSTAVLALSVFLMADDGLERHVQKTDFVGPILAASSSVLVNYFACILAIRRKYGPGGYWFWMIFIDPVIAGFGLWAFVMFFYNLKMESVETAEMPRMMRELVGVASLILAIFHIIATIGNVVGLQLVSSRRKAYEVSGVPSGGRGLLGWAHPASSTPVTHTGYPAPTRQG